MIPWDGSVVHEAALEGVRRYLAGQHRPFVPEAERCVNEGADGCAVRAEDSGWCDPCWSTVAPLPL